MYYTLDLKFLLGNFLEMPVNFHRRQFSSL